MCQRILMTGATGFLGSHLAKALLAQGYDVVALKRKTSALYRIESILSKITFYDVEELDFDSLFLKENKIDAVIHTATIYGRDGESSSEIFATNTIFPLSLLDAAIRADVKLFINTDTVLDKYLNVYALSKNQFMQWGRYFSQKNKIHFVNLRLEHFYGQGDDDSKFTSYVINNCILNTSSLKLTLGEQRRDFIYIDDAVAAYLVVLKSVNLLDERFVECDVGSGTTVSIREFVELVHRMTGSKTSLEFGAIPYREGEEMNSHADTHVLKSLGWYCKYSLEQGLKLIIEGQQ
jgi:CDP-paratose synthetase